MSVRILTGDCRNVLATLPDESVHCVVTSPPYFGLRDYGMDGQIGLEDTPDAFVAEMVAVFREVRRVLRNDGTFWLNLGDSYAGGGGGNYGNKIAPDHGQHATNVRNRPRWLQNAGLKAKDLIGIPWRVAFALQADGWYLRSDIIWHKPNPMPESVTDRPTSAHEHVFLFSKSPSYFYDHEAVKEPAAATTIERAAKGYRQGGTNAPDRGDAERHAERVFSANPRNLRNVWTIATQPYTEAHFATFPPSLIEPCIKAGCPAGGTVLDPFGGAGTTGLVADRLGRDAILIELNPAYASMARDRLSLDGGMFASVAAE